MRHNTVVYGAPVMYSLFSLIGMAIIAAGMSFLVFPFAITRPLFYFLSMNTALALGLFRFCTGIKSAAWSRTETKVSTLKIRLGGH